MVGKIGPSDDSAGKIQQQPDKLSFTHDYTPKQQRAINQHINELKSLLNSKNAHDPDVQQQITELRQQIQSQELPSIGLNAKSSPSVTNAMRYIDEQSGYTDRLSAARQKTQIAPSTSSSRSGRRALRGLGGSAPTRSTTKARLQAPGAASVKLAQTARTQAPADDLNTIAANYNTWKDQHKTDVTNNQNIFTEIDGAINAFQNSISQDNGPSLRAFIQADTNQNSCTKTLFQPATYTKFSSPDALASLLTTLNFDKSLFPSQSTEAGPQVKPGYTAFVLKNIPPGTKIEIGNNLALPPSNPGNNPGAYYLTMQKGQQFLTKTSTHTLFPVENLPTINGQPYIYIPDNMPGGRIYYIPSNSSSQTMDTSFTEFTTGANSANVDFTAVDGLPAMATNVQMTATNTATSRNGMAVDRNTFIQKMQALYTKYDKTSDQAWVKTLSDPNAFIPSGKNISSPSIQNSLQSYLQNTFIPGLKPGTPPLYLAGGIIGHIVPSGAGYAFRTDDGKTTLALPSLTDVSGWFSGSDQAWHFGSDPAKAAIVKGLSSLVTVGIEPKDINSGPTNPVGTGYFTNIQNAQHFYEASFYNLYRRAVHESGCNAYASDFDDVLGGDADMGTGNVTGEHAFFTVDFPSSTPEPPPVNPTSALVDQIYNKSTDNPPGIDFRSAFQTNMKTPLSQLNTAIAQYNADVTAYNKLPDSDPTKLDTWNALSTKSGNITTQLGMFTGNVKNLINAYSPTINGDLKTTLTAAQMQDMAKDIVTRKEVGLGDITTASTLPVKPPPPGPTPFDPKDALNKIMTYDYTGEPVDFKAQMNKSISGIQTALDAYNAKLDDYNKIPATDPKAQQDFITNVLSPLKQEVTRQSQLYFANDPNFNLLYYSPNELGKIIGFDPAKITQPQLDSYCSQIDKYFNANNVPKVPTLPTPSGTNPAQQYLGTLDTWLKNHNDTGGGAGSIQQALEIPLKNAIQAGGFNTVAQIQNWFKTSPDGIKAFGAITNSSIYANDPALKALPPGKPQSDMLQGLFDQLHITDPVPPPPSGKRPIDQFTATLSDWLNAHGDTDPNKGIRQAFYTPLMNAINGSPYLQTLDDMKKWLQTNPVGQKAMGYLTNSAIYVQDPGLEKLSPDDSQKALQSIFDSSGLSAISPIPQMVVAKVKDYLDMQWLPKQPGDDKFNPPVGTQGYLRTTFINKLFQQIDGQQIKTMSQLTAWVNQAVQGGGQWSGPSGLANASIYTLDPAFNAMAPPKTQAQGILQDLFGVLKITSVPVPTPTPTPPPINPAQQYLSTLDAWLKAHNDLNQGAGSIYQVLEQKLKSAIQTGGFTTTAQIQNWFATSPDGQAAMRAITSSSIYANDPALKALPPGKPQSDALQDLFNQLNITTPVPTPPGPPPPPDDLTKLFKAYPQVIQPLYNAHVTELQQDLKVHASPQDMLSHVYSHFAGNVEKLNYMIQNFPKNFPFPIPTNPSDVKQLVQRLATELCQGEWKDAGCPGSCPPLPPPK
jgi:hypothetical protein